MWGPCLDTLDEDTWEDIGCGDKQDMKDIGIERVFNAGQSQEEDYKSDIHEEQGCKVRVTLLHNTVQIGQIRMLLLLQSYMVFTKKCSDLAGTICSLVSFSLLILEMENI